MRLSNQIKQIRVQHGDSQETMATKLGVTRQAVSNWELGASFPDLQVLVKICELYDITLEQLVKGDGIFHLPFDVGIAYTRNRLLKHFGINCLFYLFFSFTFATIFYEVLGMTYINAILLSMMIFISFYLLLVFPFNQRFTHWQMTADGFRVYDATYVNQIKTLFLVLFKGTNMSLYTFIPWYDVDHVLIKFRKFIMNPKRDYAYKFVPTQFPVFVKHNSEPYYLLVVTKKRAYIADMVMDYKRMKGYAFLHIPEIVEWLSLKGVRVEDPLNFVENVKNGKLLYDFVYAKEDKRAEELMKGRRNF